MKERRKKKIASNSRLHKSSEKNLLLCCKCKQFKCDSEMKEMATEFQEKRGVWRDPMLKQPS